MCYFQDFFYSACSTKKCNLSEVKFANYLLENIINISFLFGVKSTTQALLSNRYSVSNTDDTQFKSFELLNLNTNVRRLDWLMSKSVSQLTYVLLSFYLFRPKTFRRVQLVISSTEVFAYTTRVDGIPIRTAVGGTQLAE